MAGDIWGDALTLPPHTLLSGDAGVVTSLPPHTLVAEAVGVVSALAPHTLAAQASYLDFLVETLPVHTLDATLVSDDIGVLDEVLAAHTADGTWITGDVATAELTLPVHDLLADCGWSTIAALPPHTLAATCLVGQVISGDIALPVYTLAAGMTSANFAEASNQLPVHVVSATSLTGGVGDAALLIPVHLLEGLGFSGEVLSASLELPLYTLVATGYGSYESVGASVMPVHTLDAAMAQAVVAAVQTWVLNVRKKALTEYTNFTFNSFAVLDGRVYAAGAEGVYELAAQDTDAGAEISATARLGQHHFGTTYSKRIPRIYLGYKATGDLEFRTITAADSRRAYLLAHNQSSAIQQRRIQINRGPKSVYWQFEIVNRAGADFLLDNIQLKPDKLARRVGEGSASSA